MSLKSLSYTEENYLKAIYHLSESGNYDVATNAIAEHLSTRPASVSDMMKKLSEKGLVDHVKYRGVNVTSVGKAKALQIIRKHRLWEVFLVEKLRFSWDEVHDVAEQLEHIRSPLLIKRLDEFLGFPKFDPHGDPIPDENGIMSVKPQRALSELEVKRTGIIVSVKDSSRSFLQYLDRVGLQIGTKVKVLEKVEYDQSMELLVEGTERVFASKEVSENILINE